MPKEGSAAPLFTTTDGEGATVRLKDFRGQKVVLYFYPKDDTPGCTKEACLIDEKGKIKKVFAKVKPEEHAREVLEEFEG